MQNSNWEAWFISKIKDINHMVITTGQKRHLIRFKLHNRNEYLKQTEDDQFCHLVNIRESL
jgi:hypothetical protein